MPKLDNRTTLTAASIDKLKHRGGSGPTEIADGVAPGLRLIIHPSGRRQLSFRGRIRGGGQVRLPLADWPAKGIDAARDHILAEARIQATIALSACQDGHDPRSTLAEPERDAAPAEADVL